MAVAQGPLSAAVLLLVSLGLHGSSSLPACPEPCTCQRAPLLNCSSSGLSLVPQRIEDSVTELDLSHNLLDSATLDRPHPNLRTVWLGNNSITRLSLCIEGNPGGRHVRGRHLHGLRPWSGQGCVPWAPTLQLLSVERNQLEELPEGLEGCESLQVLQLSFNRISTLRPGELSQLRQLVELHLDHNLITSLHPQMFQDLAQLRVLDLSFNKLTSVHPLTYLSLQNLRADVRLGGNMWQCDCSMRSLRRRMAYDSSRGQRVWSVVCASPSALSGRDLLQLEEDDLNCFNTEDRPELHQDVTVYRGSEILLSCSAQDSMWWTPRGQASVSQPQAGLLISDITDRDMGLYVCVSEEREVASVFNLQISKIGGARRKTRSVSRTSQQIIPQGPPNRIGQERNVRATSGDLTLAVCLSVFITFLIAFILGVLARPCIDILWKKVTKKRTSTGANSVSNVEQRQYDNEAYSTVEEIEQTGHHRERRVTFSTVDVTENSNVQYYDTVAGVEQESVNYSSVFECEAANAERDAHSSGDSGSENGFRQSSRNKDFEHIPDPVELGKRRGSSSSSDSSVSDQMTQRDHTKPKTPQLAEDSVQQRADLLTARTVDVPQISGLPSEPFADWSPHAKNPNLTDPDLWEGNEEQFEFSDSVQSISPRPSSAHGPFKKSKLIMPPSSNRQKRDDTSSSSSYVSEDEPTAYTVNSDHEEKLIEKNHNKPEITNASLKQDASLEKQIRGVDLVRPKHSFSSHSSDSDGEASKAKRKADKGEGKHKSMHVSDKLSSRTATGESDTREKVKPMPRTKCRAPSLGVTSHSTSRDTKAPSPPAASSSSSSSESEAEITDRKVKDNTGRVNEGIKISEPKTLSTDLDRQHIPKIKRPVDINAPLRASDSTSSDESEDETAKHKKKQKQGDVNIVGLPVKGQSVSHLGHATPIKRDVSLDIRAPSSPTDSSSSSESADETMDQKQRQGPTPMPRLQFPESQTVSHHSDTRWPAIDLEHIPRTKSGLNIKAPSPASESSSSSESDDETTNHIKTRETGRTLMARPPIKVPQTGTHDPQTQRPALNLEQTTHLKRHVDIKAPSLASDSSSSSDSEGETTGHIEKQRPGKVDIAGHQFQKSQRESPDLDRRWPVLDLEQTTRVKRRLDIKAPSPASDSSSSSDSEDETTHNTQRPGKVDITEVAFQKSPTASHHPDTMWPAIDLEHIPSIKRRLDIKKPSSPTDDRKIVQMKKLEQGEVHVSRLPQSPVIKAPSSASDSSSSSDSEDETTGHIQKQRPGKVGTVGLPLQQSQTGSQRPALDLEQTTHLKRHVDIKASSPGSDSSSSSDSEDETTGHIKKQEKMETLMARPPIKGSQTGTHDPQTQWPALDLEQTTRVKRRLDIKAPSPASDSSSSSDSEDETTHHAQRPGKVDITEVAFQKSPTASHHPDTMWPAIDLEHIPSIKRRLDIKKPSSPTDDRKIVQMKKLEQGEVHVSRLPKSPVIKAPSSASDSSSSSDSEDGTTGHIKKQRPGKVGTVGLPLQQSQTGSQWPALDLEQTTRVKRRLDIKAPSPASDSSSSSDSEDETTHHAQRPGKVDITEVAFQKSPTASHHPDTIWPAIDLEHIPSIKRRLDIKKTLSPTDDRKIVQMKKLEQGEVHVSRLPQSPVIKAPSSASDSSSSSDSEDETTGHIQKQEKMETLMARPPIKGSQTGTHDPQTQWPALDLEHTMRIKRRLDIKAPSPASDSSSSSDSEDETTHHTQRPGKVDITEIAFQKSPTASHHPDTIWPAIDLEHIPSIKRRLDIKKPSSPTDDRKIMQMKKLEQGEVHVPRFPQSPVIKAPSSASDSSSSSDSEDETTGHIQKQRPGKVGTVGLPLQQSQTGSQWPALDLEQTTRVKRRLDIKAPSPASDSSSSSDSEDETTHHIKKERPGLVGIARLPFQQSQTVRHDPETRWSAVDLGNITRIKRRLDIKAPSPASDSSSSSDSEDETTNYIKKQEKGETHMARLPTKESQTTSHDPQTQGPVLDLGHTTRIKTHLDSSSSSDSEGETTGHKEMQRPGKVVIAGLPFQESQTVRHGPDTRRPALDLEHSTRIKRRLDIKAPSQAPDSSSSSDSEDETTNYVKKQEQGKTHVAGLPTKVSQSIPLNHDPKTQWSSLDLGHTASIKRHPEVKAPSPASESSSSSDSEDETTHHTKKERPGLVVIAGVPFRQSQTARHDPETGWPAVDLGNITRIKRRLEIKTPSPPPDSLSSAGSTNHIVKVNKEAAIKSNYSSSSSDEQEGGMENLRNPPTTAEPDPDSRWPKLDLRSTHNVKRRMDITTRSLPHESFSTSVSPGTRQSESNSSTSDSEDENRDHAKLGLGVSAISKDTGKGFIKYPKSSVIHTSPKTDHNIILIKKTPLTDDVGNRTTSDNVNTMPEINPELKSRWATMSLGISRFRKRLEITAPTREPPNPPSSPPPDSPSSPTSARTRRKRWGAGMQGIIHAESSLAPENKSVNSSLSLKGQDDNFGNSVEVKETLRKDYSLPKTEEKSNPDTMSTGYGHPHFRRYLDINVTEKAPATPPLRKLSDSSSSSENEDASREHAGKGWRGRSQLPVVTDKEASQIHHSQYVLPAAGIKLDVSQSQNEEVDNIPHIRRAPNIRAPLQREASFSSNSENETIGHSVPDLSRGVPHVKRSPNVKAPSHSTSSSSDSENEVTEYTAKQSGHASDMSGLTDIDSVITYKRSIFKGSSLQTNSFSHSGPTMDHRNQIHTGAEMVTLPKESQSQSVGDSNAPFAPRRAPGMSFDDGFKKRTEQPKNTTDADLPPEIRWAGVGRQLSDLSTSSPRGHLDVGLSAPPAEPEFPLIDFSDYSSGKSDQMKQDRGKADVTLLHKYSSLSANSVSLASSRAHDNSDNLSASTNEILRGVPEDRWERKGLSALKVMSSERRKWDTQGENLPMDAPPVFDDHGPQYDSFNYLRYEEDIKPLAKQPLTGLHLSSTSGDDRRAPDFMYGIPHYRRHNIGSTAPPQEAPPPVPATPPPDEAVELTWSSPQSFKKQGLAGTRSYLQQSRNTEEPDPSQNLGVYFNSPNISHV